MYTEETDTPTSDVAPACPKCGASMVIKTARRGPTAGSQFYSCSSYPACKGTRNFEASASENGPDRAVDRPISLSRKVSTPAFAKGWSTTVLQCAAAPRSAVAFFAGGDTPDQQLFAASQWKLSVRDDAPIRRSQPLLTYLIAEKLLKRGTFVPASLLVEDLLRDILGCPVDENESWGEAIRIAACEQRIAIRCRRDFDSADEEEFFEYLSRVCADAHNWTNCQIPLGSLTASTADFASGQRVDFLFAHPFGSLAVIEVDGAQHAHSREVDAQRDGAITAAGIDVVRIPVAEARAGAGPSLHRLRSVLNGIPSGASPPQLSAKLLVACRRVHQIQLAVLSALNLGRSMGHAQAMKICVSDESLQDVARIALQDLNELFSDIAAVYDENDAVVILELADSDSADLSIAFGEPSSNTAMVVEDAYLPFSVATEMISAPFVANAIAKKGPCERLLARVFGWTSFREGQFEAIQRALAGQDSIVLLPTGSGKSIAFQLASLLRPGLCLVVDPILSLIDDQIENLRNAGIDRVAQLTSATDVKIREEVLSLLSDGTYVFCYIAPERFQSTAFRESLRALTTHTPISLVAIDEAHCVSEWGHDFRPAYLHLAAIARDYCACDGKPPPIMALTGTASRSVLKDVQRSLEIDDFEAIITPTSFDRPELRFQAITCGSAEKRQRLLGVMNGMPHQLGISRNRFFELRGKATCCGLVFCPHVNGSFGVVDVAAYLAQQLQRPVPAYSGTAPKGVGTHNWQQIRRETALKFKRNRASVMACTKAFGMGIDKPNVRFTVHFCLPASIEAFYQEAGRAGRDGQPAECLLLYSNDDKGRTRRLLDPNTGIEELHDVMEALPRDRADDITRSLWFHTNSFEGPQAEFDSVKTVLEQLGAVTTAHDCVIEYGDKNKLSKEKAIYRLVSVGVIADYTIDHSKQRFHIRVAETTAEQMAARLYEHIAAYQRDRAREALRAVTRDFGTDALGNCKRVAREMIEFVYDIVERGRRQALAEMLAACESGQDDAQLRSRILSYLGSAAFAGSIEEVISGESAGLSNALTILTEVQSSIEGSELRGQSARALEAYPDHPGLRLIRGVAEALCSNPNGAIVEENIEACARFGTTKYGIDEDVIVVAAIEVIQSLADRRLEMSQAALRGVIRGLGGSRVAARRIVTELGIPVATPAYERLFAHLHHEVTTLLKG